MKESSDEVMPLSHEEKATFTHPTAQMNIHQGRNPVALIQRNMDHMVW